MLTNNERYAILNNRYFKNILFLIKLYHKLKEGIHHG